MSVNVTCETCEARFRAKAEHAGKHCKCPKCGTVLSIPAPQGATKTTVGAGSTTQPRTTASGPSVLISPLPSENTFQPTGRAASKGGILMWTWVFGGGITLVTVAALLLSFLGSELARDDAQGQQQEQSGGAGAEQASPKQLENFKVSLDSDNPRIITVKGPFAQHQEAQLQLAFTPDGVEPGEGEFQVDTVVMTKKDAKGSYSAFRVLLIPAIGGQISLVTISDISRWQPTPKNLVFALPSEYFSGKGELLVALKSSDSTLLQERISVNFP